MNDTIKNLLVTGGVASIISVGGVALLSPQEVVIAPGEPISQECQIEEPNYSDDYSDRVQYQLDHMIATYAGESDFDNQIKEENWSRECAGIDVLTSKEEKDLRKDMKRRTKEGIAEIKSRGGVLYEQ